MERSKQHRKIYITSSNMIKLEKLLETRGERNLKDREHLEESGKELDTHEEMTYTLVFLADANVKQISLFLLQ